MRRILWTRRIYGGVVEVDSIIKVLCKLTKTAKITENAEIVKSVKIPKLRILYKSLANLYITQHVGDLGTFM